jgi:cell wall-associated NlpC family hydrolase
MLGIRAKDEGPAAVTFPDPRLTPMRPDLAARHLEGRVEAKRFGAGEARVVIEPQAPVRRAPSPDAPLDTEALMGEGVTVYELTEEGWAWGQLARDGYVGWIPASALGAPGSAATHKVGALRTLVFPGPSIKLPPIAALPFGATVTIVAVAERFAVTAAGGYVPARHLVPLDFLEPDFVAVAERFLGTPYLWGGKTNLGLDCSGLSQIALTACGIPCPRDSDMQERALGQRVTANADYSDLRRGDFVFWKGHMGIVRDPATLLHANAFHMAVALESLAEAIPRIRASDGEPTAVKRL